MQFLASALRVPITGFGALALWLLATSDGELLKILLGVGSALLAVAGYVGQTAAERAVRNQQLDQAVARKDEWEREHGDVEDRAG
ncbi:MULTISPECIES: hypothetical protein [unclassified Curtobacterium]|uniref:hypothetical protein n=1 Tax=unclassified Curtobacterium TaxID=257496 RepID=UPI000F50ACF1|nr:MULTISPECIES: hypothetical protein [unclassified Curtobacterium]RPE82455.1 hypothetical protein EDF28_2334 [Curtobacterium sp. PhB137]TCL78586.1 hypothetical protein EDF23_104210 [Curtobacterium sp. PhB128]TCL83465.1 hypothetical protein EDF31_107158 [Curtobacterium sp. PhB142]TCL95347.1 hypothetical protein EDF29_104210 [Curtobacterium sp. PhB138]TCM00986.1 hypothetical protein EDF26_107158 [Curtobacterium sp. PhB134]